MHTLEELIEAGYSIQNAKIKSISLNMEDHGCLTLDMHLEGEGWVVVYEGYLGAKEFKGSEKGMEAIMQIMNVVGVSDLLNMKDKYVRVAIKGWGSTVKIIGNIINDIWFDYETFFENEIETNADYIRHMDNVKLAEFLDQVHDDPCRAYCGNLATCLRNNASEPECKQHHLKWLEAERK